MHLQDNYKKANFRKFRFSEFEFLVISAFALLEMISFMGENDFKMLILGTEEELDRVGN